MSVYIKLDGLILNALERWSTPLYAQDVNAEADLLATLTGREAFRVIDGRMTALKKAGRIVYRTKKEAKRAGTRIGWSVTAAARGLEIDQREETA